MTKHPLVDIQDVSKVYRMPSGDVWALKKNSLTIFEGESVAIIGPSGSGKSTLLHLLGCLDSPSSGGYFLNGLDVAALDDVELSNLRATKIGFVFQSFNLIPTLTLYDNVKLPLHYQEQPLTDAEMKDRILHALESVKLSHRLFHFPPQLSGGEMQRAAIARALVINPLLILADEPTGNLDSDNASAILQLFQDLHSQGRTLVIVTHDPSVASRCQRMIAMNNGEMSHAPLLG